jgi:hypothetical protein
MMRKILIFISLMILLGFSKSYEKILSDFENKLYTNQMGKRIVIGLSDSGKLHSKNRVSSILDKNRLFEVSILNNSDDDREPFKVGIFNIWNRYENNQKRKLFTVDKVIDQGLKKADTFEDYLKKETDELRHSSWHLYIPKKIVHKYSKCLTEEKYGYRWYIFSGQMNLEEHSANFPEPLDDKMLFEIWIREDQNVWMEFYKNSENELRIAIERTFLVPDEELKFKEPESLDEMQKTFDISFKNSLFYKMNILKDTKIGEDLY